MLVWDARQSTISLVTACLLCALLMILVYDAGLAKAHWVWPILLAAGFYYITMRRSVKRLRAVRQPFPESWRELLNRHIFYYECLPPEERLVFERDLQIFLSEHRINGVGVEVTDLLRLMVASSAVMLTSGWPDWEYQNVPEILIYPNSFSENFEVSCASSRRPLAGMVVPQGAVILAQPDLLQSFSSDEDYHVGIHEFAHILDMESGLTDGVPKNLNPRWRKQWVAVFRDELERVRRGESLLQEYAGENLSECFAVAVECFFKTPQQLKEYDPVLFDLLSSFFNQTLAGN